MHIDYKKYLNLLYQAGFAGAIENSSLETFIAATDNSIYQENAELILYPKNKQDLKLLISTATNFSNLHLTARGGCTSSNGQALNNSIIIDYSRYLNKIMAINFSENWVEVEAGVTLFALNEYLTKQGYYFMPQIAVDSATIGGMIGTDAWGKSAFIHGKISDHLISAKCYNYKAAEILFAKTSTTANKQYYKIAKLIKQRQTKIEQYCSTNNCHSQGYNLSKLLEAQQPNSPYLLAGSQGSLAMIYSAKLKIFPQEKYQALVIIPYSNFNKAVKDAEKIISYKPYSLETINEHILALARTHNSFPAIKAYIEDSKNINIIEIRANSKNQLKQQLEKWQKLYKQSYICSNIEKLNQIYNLKNFGETFAHNLNNIEKSICSMQNMLIPQKISYLYFKDVQKLFHKNNVEYGIYGDLGGGYMQVRPNFSPKISSEHKLLLLKQLNQLNQKYNIIIWDSKQQATQANYKNLIANKDIIDVFKLIKKLYDPFNKFNRGKIVTPKTTKLKTNFNQDIAQNFKQDFANIIACNGNSKCLSTDKNQVMCPSEKITKQKIHSPQGRANLLRKWLYDLSVNLKPQKTEIAAIKAALDNCLNCNACRSSCPNNVNIPRYKSFFLNWYFKHIAKRNLRDLLLARSEELFAYYGKKPQLYNFILQHKLGKIIGNLIGISHFPKFYNSYYQVKSKAMITTQKTIYLVTDAFTNFAEENLLQDTVRLLEYHNYNVKILPFFISGKSYFNQGAVDKFAEVALKNIKYLNYLAAQNINLLSIEPAINLFFREDYQECFGHKIKFNIQLVEEFLAANLTKNFTQHHNKATTYYLLAHCNEKTSLPLNYQNWHKIFNYYNLELKSLPAGCCGMAGDYGHKKEFQEKAKLIYELSWKKQLEKYENIVATGFSCRSQVKKLSAQIIKHPIEVLASLITPATH